MGISIPHAELMRTLPKVSTGLQKYLWLQSQVFGATRYHADPLFRRRFNGFYRVRRGIAWQNAFYGVMAGATGQSFRDVLEAVRIATGRFEVSFASKLVASLDPTFPVVDAFVLKNVGLKLPTPGCVDRVCRACEVYDALRSRCAEFLAGSEGRTLIDEFRRFYPEANVTEMKMLDLVLWQTRG